MCTTLGSEIIHVAEQQSLPAQRAEVSISLMECWTKDGPDCCVFIDSARVPECD